jgi:thiosulfate/3-mercaptopyruvate sulfurtransferase
MRRVILVIAAVVLASLTLNATERTLPYFVSTQWLADHLNDKDLVVLQTSFSRPEYNAGHLPGARFLWFNWLAPTTPDLSTEMPALDDAQKVLEDLGISNDSKIIIVFARNNVPTTTRMLLAFSYLGFGDQVAILDGGLEAWKAEGRPVSKEAPTVTRTSVIITLHPEVITNADWVKAHLASPHVKIIDARTRNFYDGNGGGVSRTGHIKRAKSMPYASVLDSTNRILPISELQKLFEAAGVMKGDTVVTYCHVGQQATVPYAAARVLGYTAIVYDGSFEDWNVRDDSYPVEKTGTEKK